MRENREGSFGKMVQISSYDAANVLPEPNSDVPESVVFCYF